MNVMLITSDLLTDLEMITCESVSFFEGRGFKLRKWVANSLSKSILSNISQSDLGSSIREIDFGSNTTLDCKALGVVWDVENDCLRVCESSALSEVSTRRKMLRVHVSLCFSMISKESSAAAVIVLAHSFGNFSFG